MTETWTWGCDPGLTGAVAATDGMNVAVWDMPVLQVKKKRELCIPELAGWLSRDRNALGILKPSRLYLERVAARPGQGVVSMFRFGESFGIIRGICGALSIPVELVTPSHWKRVMRVPSGKDGGRFRAMEEFPRDHELFKRKKDHGRADAALLALYAHRFLSPIQA